MADDQVDLRFLGEQIKRVQGDVRVLRTDVAQLRVGKLRLAAEIGDIRTNVRRIENRMDAFAERVDGRFEQIIELMKS
jgi:hypothetical protein